MMRRTILLVSLLTFSAGDVLAVTYSKDCRREESRRDGAQRSVDSAQRGVDSAEARADGVGVRNTDALQRYDDRVTTAKENVELAKEIRTSMVKTAEDQCLANGARGDIFGLIGAIGHANGLCRQRGQAVQRGNRLVSSKQALADRLVNGRAKFVVTLERRRVAAQRSVDRANENLNRKLQTLNEAQATLDACMAQPPPAG